MAEEWPGLMKPQESKVETGEVSIEELNQRFSKAKGIIIEKIGEDNKIKQYKGEYPVVVVRYVRDEMTDIDVFVEYLDNPESDPDNPEILLYFTDHYDFIDDGNSFAAEQEKRDEAKLERLLSENKDKIVE